jgi:hypothetical protein
MKLKNSDNLRNGDVLHCKRNSFLSKAIRFFTVSDKTSHTALVQKLHGNVFIVDSQADGTRLRTFEDWNEKYKYDVIITRGEKISEEELLDAIQPYLNSMYGYWDIVKHIFRTRLGIWMGSKREDKYLICSEFVLRVFGNKDAYKSDPEDAYIWFLENGFKVVKEDARKTE